MSILGVPLSRLERIPTRNNMTISAVTGDLVSRFISFLMNKYSDHASLNKKVERLQQLLMRVHTVVEEADGRYIINNGMLIQLKMVTEVMYRGYHVLDTFKCELLKEVTKQEVINILLQDNPLGAPTVLPIICGHGVGKKTLVAHICNDERVRSCFSSILHFGGDNLRKVGSERNMFHRTLLIVVFHSNVNDKEWIKFYSCVTCMGTGSKVIIISRLQILLRFGTVKPIHLNSLSNQEFSYLFKTLAFGSANPVDHPWLISTVKEFEPELGGSFVGTFMIADVLRKNVNLQFWLCILKMCRTVVQRNFTLFGEHPKILYGRNHPVDMTNNICSPAAPLLLLSNIFKVELPGCAETGGMRVFFGGWQLRTWGEGGGRETEFRRWSSAAEGRGCPAGGGGRRAHQRGRMVAATEFGQSGGRQAGSGATRRQS